MKSMNLKPYTPPETEAQFASLGEALLITSGSDNYHEGGAGYYGDNDINDNDYVFR